MLRLRAPQRGLQPATTTTEPIPESKIASTHAAVLSLVQPRETAKTTVTEHQATSDKAAVQNSIVVLLVLPHSAVSPLPFGETSTDSNAIKIDQPVSEPVPVVAHPELDTPLKMPMVTTDPVRNVAQQQLPPRIMPVLKVVPDANPADRSKPSATPGRDLVAGASARQLTDVVRPVERVDQAPAAHTIEIPNISNLPVVRIVAMQVGEADSEVTIHIQQRGTDLTLQLNAANCSLHQNLESAAGSLANALKLENVPVSGIEVSRTSLTDKVRRMKETQ